MLPKVLNNLTTMQEQHSWWGILQKITEPVLSLLYDQQDSILVGNRKIYKSDRQRYVLNFNICKDYI
jgi:hypothetical protein